MSWLRKKVEKLLTTKTFIERRYGSGRVEKLQTGRRPRFITVMMAEHPKWFLVMFATLAVSITFIIIGYDQAFARFGAVVVLVGILFGMTSIRAIRDETDIKVFSELMKASAQIADAVAVSRQNTSSRVIAGTVPGSIGANIPIAVRELQKSARDATRFYYRTEMSFAVIGTLQWAFGDWLVSLMHNTLGG